MSASISNNKKLNVENLNINAVTNFLNNHSKKKKYYVLTLKQCDLSNSAGLYNLVKAICKFTHLQTVNLRGCQLKQFPAGLLQLRKIKELDIEDNEITEIPTLVSHHKTLKKIYVLPNPINYFHPETIDCLVFRGIALIPPLRTRRPVIHKLRAYKAFPNGKDSFPSLKSLASIIIITKKCDYTLLPPIIQQQGPKSVVNCPTCKDGSALLNGKTKALQTEKTVFYAQPNNPFRWEMPSSNVGLIMLLVDACKNCYQMSVYQKNQITKQDHDNEHGHFMNSQEI
jgi:Leucine-rich repeat (LRR) protein